MTTAIKVENLSKKYLINHQKKSDRYETFSDSLVLASKNIAKRIIHPFSGREIDSSTQEEFWALKDINFEINQGDKVGIIGRNGAGKSTLLKVLSRITEPTSGKIHINGRIASLLEVGTGFHPELSGRENIYLNGAILGMSRKEIKAKFDEIVAFAEVEKFLDTPVKRYSSGMYVRLAFSVAAHLEPDILVVDEVLAVGDIEFQKKCLGKMNDVAKDGRTILFVSHNLAAINQITDRALFLIQGQIACDDETAVAMRVYTQAVDNKKSLNNIQSLDDGMVLLLIQYVENATQYFNAPLTFELVIDVLKNYQNLNIAIGLHNSLGSRLVTAKNMLKKIDKGDRKLKISIMNHNLPPGLYSVTLGIAEASNTVIYQENIFSFEITDIGVDDPLLIPYLANGRDKIGAFIHSNITEII